MDKPSQELVQEKTENKPPIKRRLSENIRLSLIVAIVLLISSIPYFVYLTWNSKQKQQTPVDNVVPVSIAPSTLSPSPNADETANWQTYRNEEFGFEVRYPDQWKVFEREDGVISISPDPEKTELSGAGNFIRVKSIAVEDGKTPQQIMVENTFLGESDRNPESFAAFEERELGDNSFFYIHNYLSEGQHGGIYYIADDERVLMFNFTAYIDMDIFTGEKSFTATQAEKDEATEEGVVHLTTKEILSTFQFIQKEGNNEQLLGDATTKEECLTKYGVWQKWGLAQLEYCQIPAKDAGKSCTDQSQCTYGCISETGTVPGKCATYKNTFGCFSPVLNGKAESPLC